MEMIWIIYIFVIGLCIGSFINVLIDRLPEGKDIIFKSSHCDSCHRKLKPLDLIPLLSFIYLRGKCRFCRKKLSFYYPLVELITGLFFVYVFSLSFSFFVKCYLLIIICCLIVIFFSDLKYLIIPDEMIILSLLITLVVMFTQPWDVVKLKLVSGLVAALFFLSLYLLTKGKGMGFGDVKLALLMGFLLGWPKILIAVYIAFLTGAAVGVILILIRKKKFGQVIPFGPFLVLGTIIALFWGDILRLWINL